MSAETGEETLMNLTAGTALQGGKYILSNILHRDELSVTFEATQTTFAKPVVLKTICPNRQIPIDFAQLKQQFIKDAHQFARQQHPGLMGVLDMFEESGVPFVVMEYVPGESLADLVQARGPLPEDQALHYIRQVGSALSSLHRNGLVHQAVKPGNMIRPSGADFVVLVEFGISYQTLLRTTETLALPGDEYAAPEQVRSLDRPVPGTDIYSLAASLYFLLIGKPPIHALQRGRYPLPALRQLNPHLSSQVEAAILSGMEMNFQSRPQTIAAWFSLLPHRQASPAMPDLHPHAEMAPIAGMAPIHEAPQFSVNSNGAAAAAASKPQPPTANSATQVVAPVATNAVISRTIAPKRQFSKTLMLVSAIAVVIGVGTGIALRMSGATGPGTSIFHTEQAFPPLQNWPGAAKPLDPPAVTSPAAPSTPSRQREPASVTPASERQSPSPAIAPAPAAKPNSQPPAEAIAPAAKSAQPDTIPAPSPDAAPANSAQPPANSPAPVAPLPPQPAPAVQAPAAAPSPANTPKTDG